MTWDNLQNKESKLPEISVEDQKINKLFATVFKTDAGKEVLAYLKSITAETVSGPNVSNSQLFHLEGMRYLFAIIQNKINKGKEDK
jgi:hypothetical protein